MANTENEWELEEGIPQFEDPFIQQYLKGRDALIMEEKKRRHGISHSNPVKTSYLTFFCRCKSAQIFITYRRPGDEDCVTYPSSGTEQAVVKWVE